MTNQNINTTNTTNTENNTNNNTNNNKNKKTNYYNKLDSKYLFNLFFKDKVEFFREIIKNKDKDIFYLRNEDNFRAIDLFLKNYYELTINNKNSNDDDIQFLLSLRVEPRAILLNNHYYNISDEELESILNNYEVDIKEIKNIIRIRSLLKNLEYDNGFSLYKDICIENNDKYEVSKKERGYFKRN